MEFRKELAKKHLKKHIIKNNVTYRGVPTLEFDREELLKILDIFMGLNKKQREHIELLSRL